jgi:hypothetical protein
LLLLIIILAFCVLLSLKIRSYREKLVPGKEVQHIIDAVYKYKINRINLNLEIYRFENKQWPDNLQVLVDQRYLTAFEIRDLKGRKFQYKIIQGNPYIE